MVYGLLKVKSLYFENFCQNSVTFDFYCSITLRKGKVFVFNFKYFLYLFIYLKQNEIEQDDIENVEPNGMFDKMSYLEHQPLYEGVNWEQESSEHKLNENNSTNIESLELTKSS